MPELKTADLARPLDQSEQDKLQEYLARASAGQGPSVRIGDPYIALTNLSVPRRGDPDKQVDLVRPGETVYLTKEEAARFMRHGPRDGRQISVIVPKGESEQAAAGRIPPRALSGQLMGPPADARPDPAGSSAIQVVEPPAKVPESAEPVAGTENTGGQAAGAPAVDAEDILPSRVRARQARKTE